MTTRRIKAEDDVIRANNDNDMSREAALNHSNWGPNEGHENDASFHPTNIESSRDHFSDTPQPDMPLSLGFHVDNGSLHKPEGRNGSNGRNTAAAEAAATGRAAGERPTGNSTDNPNANDFPTDQVCVKNLQVLIDRDSIQSNTQLNPVPKEHWHLLKFPPGCVVQLGSTDSFYIGVGKVKGVCLHWEDYNPNRYHISFLCASQSSSDAVTASDNEQDLINSLQDVLVLEDHLEFGVRCPVQVITKDKGRQRGRVVSLYTKSTEVTSSENDGWMYSILTQEGGVTRSVYHGIEKEQITFDHEKEQITFDQDIPTHDDEYRTALDAKANFDPIHQEDVALVRFHDNQLKFPSRCNVLVVFNEKENLFCHLGTVKRGGVDLRSKKKMYEVQLAHMGSRGNLVTVFEEHLMLAPGTPAYFGHEECTIVGAQHCKENIANTLRYEVKLTQDPTSVYSGINPEQHDAVIFVTRLKSSKPAIATETLHAGMRKTPIAHISKFQISTFWFSQS